MMVLAMERDVAAIFRMLQRRPTRVGPGASEHRGALCLRLGAGTWITNLDFGSSLYEGCVWTSAAQFQDPLAFGLHASGSRHDFDLSAVQLSGLPGKRSTLDSYRDPALGRIIHSGWVASFDLLKDEWIRRTPRPR